MSIIAKILVVLNLILAVVFLGASSTYLGQKESWKMQYQNLDRRLNEEILTLKANLANADTNLKEQREKTDTAQNEVTELKKTLQNQESAQKALVTEHESLKGAHDTLTKTVADLKVSIEQLTTDKNQALAAREAAITERQQAVDDKNKAVTEQQRLESELASAKEMADTLQKQVVSVSDELDKTKLIVKAYEDKVGVLPAIVGGIPTIKAMVSGVDNNLNIVMLSVGRDDKVQVGYEFTIYRGSEYVGKVVINRVERDYCSGESKKEVQKSPIQVGDQATTRF